MGDCCGGLNSYEGGELTAIWEWLEEDWWEGDEGGRGFTYEGS